MSSGNVFAKIRITRKTNKKAIWRRHYRNFGEERSSGNFHELELASAIVPGGEAVINTAGQVGAEYL